MSVITIMLGTKAFQLNCPDENKRQLFVLSDQLNLELDRVREENPSASFDLLLVIILFELLADRHSKFRKTAGEIVDKMDCTFKKQLSEISVALTTLLRKIE